MRLWHRKLLPYLPDMQFRGQRRELIAIMHDWSRKGKTNHLLINRVMNYDKFQLAQYAVEYELEWQRRYGKSIGEKFIEEILVFEDGQDAPFTEIFTDWHNKEYLRVCMANLFEKYKFGVGKSKITEVDWQTLADGYRKITGEIYSI